MGGVSFLQPSVMANNPKAVKDLGNVERGRIEKKNTNLQVPNPLGATVLQPSVSVNIQHLL